MRGSNVSKIPLVGFVATFILVVLIVQQTAAAPEADLPPGFRTAQIVDGLISPTDFVLLPDGKIMIIDLGTGVGSAAVARVLIAEPQEVGRTPVLRLSVTREQDSGLLAIALDPDFANNGWFYLWYASGEDAKDWNGAPEMRLSRFTYDPLTQTADPASELIVLSTGSWEIWHHGNRLMFDAVGNLWIAVGELATISPHAQDLSRLEGKVLRIRPTATGYAIPNDNPFVDTPGVRPEIYAYGFRNPYVMTQRSDGLIAVGDVGSLRYEEINLLAPGKNYGWPIREGICPRAQYPPCDAASAEYTDPTIYWRHDLPPDTLSSAITGLTFYEGDNFPEAYHGKLFYFDLGRLWIRVGDAETGESEHFADMPDRLTRLRVHNGQLFYLSAYTGELNLIYFEGGNNIAPSVTLSADTQTGTAPLRVVLSAEGSDPDDLSIRYRWDFGDGTPTFETDQTLFTHVYAEDGVYEATVTAIDSRGAESAPATVPIVVYSGEWPRLIVENQTAPGRTLYHAGDTVTYRAERSTVSDLEETPYSWDVLLHHADHTHVTLSNNTVISDTFVIPTLNHDSATDLWYGFYLTMYTDSGLEIALSKQIEPARTTMRFETTPSNYRLTINGVEVQAPYSLDAIVGIENQVIANPNLSLDGVLRRASRWQLEGNTLATGPMLNLFAPAAEHTYTAVYEIDENAPTQLIPVIIND